jgi:hypothetical protein
MWDWINCNLLGRHQLVVASDRASIHLRCLRCGHRSGGWQLAARALTVQPLQPWRRPLAQPTPRSNA